jgi:hypothetical protein
MPNVNSLFISPTDFDTLKKGSNNVNIDSRDCCAYLLETSTLEYGIIPSKYGFSTIDHTDYIKEWFVFLEKHLKIPIEYEVLEFPITGLYSALYKLSFFIIWSRTFFNSICSNRY